MHASFEPLIHIDWKLPGGELLALFQHYYPDLPLFAGPSFETLVDEFCNEMPERCLDALAPLLAAQGYDLWNLDAGADDYRPVIVPTALRQAFAEHWQSHPGDFELTPCLIEPAAPAAKNPKAKRSKLKWLQEVHEYPGPTYFDESQFSNGYAAITEEDEGQWLCFLIDYNQWPPTEQDMLENRSDDIDGADLRLLEASAEHSLWKRRAVSGNYSHDDRYVYELRRGDDIQAFGPAGEQWPGFEIPSLVMDGEIFERHRLYEPSPLTRVWRITPRSSEVIFEFEDELTILSFGPGRVLFMQHNGSLCWIWNRDTQQVSQGQPLPCSAYQLRAASAYLGDDEVLLFSESHRQNTEHDGYQETVLQAWRFNVLSGATRKALLDGFGSEVQQETRMLVTQPKHSITLRTFHGQLQVARGHGEWWLWTYRSNTFGTHTLAWWWNQRSHEVLKLTSRDIPRVKPQVVYAPAQDRYLALEDDFVARLPAFADMLQPRGVEVLLFE